MGSEMCIRDSDTTGAWNSIEGPLPGKANRALTEEVIKRLWHPDKAVSRGIAREDAEEKSRRLAMPMRLSGGSLIPSAEAHIQELPLTNQPTLTTFSVRRSAVGVGQRIAAVIIAKRPTTLEERNISTRPHQKTIRRNRSNLRT